MRKYVYENAIVYITEPNDDQLDNIRKATERFTKELAKKGLLENDKRSNNRRASRSNSNTRKRT